MCVESSTMGINGEGNYTKQSKLKQIVKRKELLLLLLLLLLVGVYRVWSSVVSTYSAISISAAPSEISAK